MKIKCSLSARSYFRCWGWWTKFFLSIYFTPKQRCYFISSNIKPIPLLLFLLHHFFMKMKITTTVSHVASFKRYFKNMHYREDMIRWGKVWSYLQVRNQICMYPSKIVYAVYMMYHYFTYRECHFLLQGLRYLTKELIFKLSPRIWSYHGINVINTIWKKEKKHFFLLTA